MAQITPPPTAYFAFTAPINPSGLTPTLTRAQIWKALEYKVRHPEEFVAGAIKSTNVLSTHTDDKGREVITREVVFTDGDRKVKEVCTLYEDMKVEFQMPDGSRVLNTVSDAADGQIYLTYQFEWVMKEDTPVETQKENRQKWKKMSQMSVESSIRTMRKMAEEGKIE